MGLTVHFTITAPVGIDSMAAKRLVLAAREIALTAQRRGEFDKISDLREDEHARLRSLEWLIVPVPGFANASTGIEIAPLEGHVFRIRVGEGSEPLWIGLCRYPTRVDVDGVQTNVRRGGRWRLTGFCKTQYASVHGWEHFRRCMWASFRCSRNSARSACVCGFRMKVDTGRADPSASCARRSTR